MNKNIIAARKTHKKYYTDSFYPIIERQLTGVLIGNNSCSTALTTTPFSNMASSCLNQLH